MRTITAAQQACLNAGTQAEYVRVRVKDSGGTFRDLTTYPGFNTVKSVKWEEKIDSPHSTFSISLFRELYNLSLSPYVTGSPLNKAFVYPGTFAALLALNREIAIDAAVVPTDTKPASGDWMEVFHGRIETLDAAQDRDIEITGTSLSGRLSKQYIKTEKVYSYAADGGSAVALRVWEPGVAVTTSPLVYVLPASRGDSDPGLNKFLKCSQAGTTGATEPIWTTGSGQTDGTAKWDYVGAPTTSGNPVEQIMQNIMNDNVGSGETALTLNTPVSPGWNITQFAQQRQFTMDAIGALAAQIGWDLRMKWDSGSSSWKLTFYQPNRGFLVGVDTADYAFAGSDYRKPTALKVDLSTIRNVVRVIYPDPADPWPDGTPKRKIVEVSDSSSITKYGEQWMEIQEDETSNIDTSTEASAFALAALSDCSEPTAELSVPLVSGFPWVELNDMYEFHPNVVQGGVQFDSTQTLAVTSYSHSSEAGKGLRTTLECRGLPTIGARKYLGISEHPKLPHKATPHRNVAFNGTKTVNVGATSVVGGQRLSVSQTFEKNQLPEEYEHHVYTSSGATLDSSTLKAVTRSRTVEVSDLIPGKTYYTKTVPRFRNADRVVRGQPSVEASFVAGQASAGHIVDGIALGDYPLNGGFETRLDTAAMPDHWTVYAGSFGTDVDVMEDGNGLSGNRYMRLKTHSGGIRSAVFPLLNEAMESSRRGGLYRMSWWRKAGSSNSAGATYDTLIRLLDYTGAEVDIVTVASARACDDRKGHWVLEEVYVQLRAGDPSVRSAQLQIIGHAGATFQLDVDEYRVQFLGSPWFQVGDTSDFTDAYESIPGFDNTYQAFNTGTDTIPAFRRNQFGRVFIEGALKHATTTKVGFSLFTLPASFCPPLKRSFPVTANGKHALVEISTGGAVTLVSADDANPSTKICLDGISFEVTNVS